MSDIGRREFLSGLAAAPAALAQRGANDRIGIAMVGVGTRGHFLLQQIQQVPNTEVRILCDLYEGNLSRARKLTTNPNARIVMDWEKAVTDKDIDAVIIATPDFWHAPQTIRAAEAKKDIYVEKGWCRTLAEAKAMRKAVKDNKVVMQLGHNYNSLPVLHKAREIYQSGALGKLPLVRTYIDRTGVEPEWQFYGAYDVKQPPKDASEGSIDWKRFIANATPREFDVQRFFTWRRWWEYGSGIAGDLMSHLWDSVNGVLGMGIPETAVTQGGNYFWKDGRDVPDMWHVLFDYPSKELAITFGCSFHNRHQGELAQYLGREKTMEMNPGFLRTYIAEWKQEYYDRLGAARRAAVKAGKSPEDAAVDPDYVFKKGELEVSTHWQNFVDCIRTRETPRCGVDRAFEEAVAIVMSIEAYKQKRQVRWDAAREEVV
ncbi:MAG TPA: Gfo/Idh/MocA family oxidoreductase [Bryobacteraceae bacterium]|nr:Gfo/Idh/MocA family oxidoreductase [Bryobacteraceae bacterium]